MTNGALSKSAFCPGTRTDSGASDSCNSSQHDGKTQLKPVIDEDKKVSPLDLAEHQQDLTESAEEACSKHLSTGLDAHQVLPRTAVTDIDQDSKVHMNAHVSEDRSHLMDLIAKCQIAGILDETDKNRICEDMASFGSQVDPTWLKGTLRTLEGLLEEHESSVIAPSIPLESSTDDLFSVSLRSSVMGSKEGGSHTDLGASDEWEGLGTNSSKASFDSLAAADTQSKASLDSLVPVEAHETEEGLPAAATQSNSKAESSNESGTPMILSMAAIGVAALGAFVASRKPTKEDRSNARRENQSGDNNDTDWVQVEPRTEE